jgi:hypothetical protein
MYMLSASFASENGFDEPGSLNHCCTFTLQTAADRRMIDANGCCSKIQLID